MQEERSLAKVEQVPKAVEKAEPRPKEEFVEPEIVVLQRMGAGALELSKEEIAVLTARIPDEMMCIRPDGPVYLPEVFYRRTLNNIFGPGHWALVPRGNPAIRGNTVVFPGALFVRGKFVACAVGEQEYFPNNARMTEATALEAAKSNCLVRCCKDLGIALQCWEPEYGDAWRAKHAHQERDDRGRLVWVKNKQAANQGEQIKKPTPVSSQKEEQISDKPSDRVSERMRKLKEADELKKLRRQLFSVWFSGARKSLGDEASQKREEMEAGVRLLLAQIGVESTKDLSASYLNKLIEFIEKHTFDYRYGLVLDATNQPLDVMLLEAYPELEIGPGDVLEQPQSKQPKAPDQLERPA